MVNLASDPAIDVTQACVRRRFRFSSCRACADVCPAQAFLLTQGQASIDTARCIACGDCLFVCPVDAITGIKPVKRFVQGDTLVGPFSLQAPTVDELLLWHSQYGIRFIDIAVERSAQWLMALAGLNLALRRYAATPRRAGLLNTWSAQRLTFRGARCFMCRVTPLLRAPSNRVNGVSGRHFPPSANACPKSAWKYVGCAALVGEAVRKMLSSLPTIP